MEQHIRILGVLHIINGVMLLIFGFIGIAVLGFLGLAATGIGHSGYVAIEGGHLSVPGLLTFIAMIIGIIAVVAGLPGIIGGWGLLAKKSWARIVVLIVGILNLTNFPLGTALGIYTLWVLLKPESQSVPAP
ncbi:MAG: hypothetical protein PHR28_03070 [candidate division Zixibacteria bacterium]|nr:hypothetical protein [candidate division Zixibacteria bacterium]